MKIKAHLPHPSKFKHYYFWVIIHQNVASLCRAHKKDTGETVDGLRGVCQSWVNWQFTKGQKRAKRGPCFGFIRLPAIHEKLDEIVAHECAHGVFHYARFMRWKLNRVRTKTPGRFVSQDEEDFCQSLGWLTIQCWDALRKNYAHKNPALALAKSQK